jgi:hypothetical protein
VAAPRCDIARAGGYRTEETWDVEGIVLDWDTITDGNILGVWRTPQADPLLVLPAHSDTLGTIPSDAIRLADRLTELLIPSNWRAVTETFIAVCRLAGYGNGPMEFSYGMAATMQGVIEKLLREKLSAIGPGRVEVRIPEWNMNRRSEGFIPFDRWDNGRTAPMRHAMIAPSGGPGCAVLRKSSTRAHLRNAMYQAG